MVRRAPRNSGKAEESEAWSWSAVDGMTEEAQADKVNGEAVEKAPEKAAKKGKVKPPTKKPYTLDPDAPLQGLTSKQEQYALLFVAGNAKSDAYRQAYNVGKDTKLETIYRSAVEIAANPKVRARIAQLKERQEAKLSYSHEQIRGHVLDTWFEILLSPTASPTARLKAGELLAKVPGVDLLKEDNSGHASGMTADEVKAEILSTLRGLLPADGETAQVIDNNE